VVLATRSPGDFTDRSFDVLAEQARLRGWRLLDIGLTGESLAGEPTPAGALVTRLPSDPLVARLRAQGCPVVRVGRLEHPDDASVPAVLPDLTQAGRMAAEHFAERGFRNLALFGHSAMEIVPQIEAGLRERAEALGCTLQRYMLSNPQGTATSGKRGDSRQEQRNAAVTAWLNAMPRPLGLLACSDYYAGMINVICQQAGMPVPEDVAVLSLGNHRRICELASVPLSAVDIDSSHTMGVAMEVLGRMMAGEPVDARTFVPPARVVTRRSTDILAVDHPLVARAIRLIWDNLDQDLSVDDVAAGVRTPRYKLERLFRKHFARGIHAELRRVRLERFAELLRTTDQPVRELAPLVGFNSPKFLHDSFCKEYGTTPRQYRLRANAKPATTADTPL